MGKIFVFCKLSYIYLIRITEYCLKLPGFAISAPGFTSKRGYCRGHTILAGFGLTQEGCAAKCRSMNGLKKCKSFMYFHAGRSKGLASCIIRDRPCTNPTPWFQKGVIVYAYSKTAEKGRRLIVDASS